MGQRMAFSRRLGHATSRCFCEWVWCGGVGLALGGAWLIASIGAKDWKG